MVRRSREIYAQHGSMGISAKYSIAHSHAWATGRIIIRCSNLANYKFTLVPACINQLATIGIKLCHTAPGSKGGESETELVVSSTMQGPAKNAIKIDVLLTDSDNRGS